MAESVKVAVRVRPFNGREKERNAKCIIRMQGPTTIITNPDTQEEKDFAFDFSYWSHDGFDVLNEPEPDLGLPGGGYNAIGNRRGGPTTSPFGMEYADQRLVYLGLGQSVLDNALQGFNCCLFAYGQTGSGKSYSFVGYGSNKGIVPQVCDTVFQKKAELATRNIDLQVTFSMMEIYNEKIRDLLNPDPKTNNDLKVRTTPNGTFVEGTKAKAVGTFKQISDTMDAGTASRTVAATQMNATSSRAHTIMTISIKQIITEEGRVRELRSDMNLVDLAGSERAESTGATGDRLKEGAAINKSLSSLGNVIKALADQSNNPGKKVFVPYRDSKLTQILQSALGGNSKTIMVAALSPADINYEETLSTLRYADRAKQIKVVVQVMENPTDKMIRELKEDNEKLKKMLEAMGGEGFDPAKFASAAGVVSHSGMITEEQMQEAIEKAVQEVKAASAAEKKAAIEKMKQEMMARHMGLSSGMLSRIDVELTLKEAVAGSSVNDQEKATRVAMDELSKKCERRQANGGSLDEHDAMAIVDEALTMISADTSAAKAKAATLLSPNQYIKGVEEMNSILAQILAAIGEGLDPHEKGRCLERANFLYQQGRQFAMSHLYSKAAVLALVGTSLKSAGGDTDALRKGQVAAEVKFDQLLRDREEGIIDESGMQATMERAMGAMGGDQKERLAQMAAAKRGVGFTVRARSMGSAEMRAKMQIAQALMKNQERMSELTQSFDSKLSQSEAESAMLLQSLGLTGITEKEMKVTPSLRNLNQDPTMSEMLVYYLKPGQTMITTPEDEGKPAQSIAISGGGVMRGHGTVVFGRELSPPLRYIKGAGISFINGKPVEADETLLRHDDRLILGNSQAFRVVDPLDPNAKKASKIIDWDLAQTELAQALGTAVDLKVEEQVAKKKAELDAQLKAMEEKFAAENERLRQELAKGGKGSASQQSQLKQMDRRKASIESFSAKAKAHVNEYKRELYALEDQLKKVMPVVMEANQMAKQLGRCVSYEAKLVTHIPQSHLIDPLSPVEELLTQKVIELLIKVTLHNPRTDMKREWYWDTEPFFDRLGRMRLVWQKWMLEHVMVPTHSPEDPFWSPPKPQLVGFAYLYLAPVAYCCPCKQWVPIYNHAGAKQGELSVVLKPTKPDMKSPLPPTSDPNSLLGKRLDFEMTIESCRGLMDCPNKNVSVEYMFKAEEGTRTTPPCSGKKFDPKFSEKHLFTLPKVEELHIAYLCKDAICFEVWGESEDVEETDVAEAISMELPPETFEFFLAHDVRLTESGYQCAFAPDLHKNKKTLPAGALAAGHSISQETHHVLDFSIAQTEKHFKVANVGRVSLGNWRDAEGKAVPGTPWTPLKITKQGRASDAEPWKVECEWTALPPLMNEPEKAGQVYFVDLKAEIQEIERLGLEEGLQLLKTLTLRLEPKGTNILGFGSYSEKEKAARDRATSVLQEVYMGQFEVSDAAVNLAMMNLREESGGDTKSIIKNHESEVEQLKKLLVDECNRQYEDLALKAEPLGFDLAPSLALWTLPSEVLGGLEMMGADKESLQKMVNQLKLELKAAKERIAYLEGASSVSKAQKQIQRLRHEMLQRKAASGAPRADGSKACVIS